MMRLFLAACLLSASSLALPQLASNAFAAASEQGCSGPECQSQKAPTERNCRSKTPVA